jgi:hypothetical protein
MTCIDLRCSSACGDVTLFDGSDIVAYPSSERGIPNTCIGRSRGGMLGLLAHTVLVLYELACGLILLVIR